MQEYEEKGEKLHTSIKRSSVCLYIEKWLQNYVKTAILISELRELNILGPWKRCENFLAFILQYGKRKEFLLRVLYEGTQNIKRIKHDICQLKLGSLGFANDG